MKPEVEQILRSADLRGWVGVGVELGAGEIEIRVPPGCRTLEMKEARPLPDPRGAILASLADPIGTPPLDEIVRRERKDAASLTACITTSDITRPVPYRGEAGILPPLLDALRRAGLRRENVTLLVGTGTHRPSTPEEKLAMFGPEVVGSYRILDHDCDDESGLVRIGRTRAGTDILLNRTFVEADLKIATGLVESHFMAGISGGRKAVCPALVSRKTIERFHSVDFLDSPLATNLVLDGNPCHEEALEIATAAGVDFVVNAVLDRRMKLVGVTCGELERSHLAAYEQVRAFAAVPVDREFDVVLTHGGYVGINHYQNAKAAVNALPIVRRGGRVILAAYERDVDPVGPVTYRTLLHLLKLQGPEGYLAMLRAPSWKFTKDQWEPQMWGKVLARIGEDGIVYCSPVLSRADAAIVPGRMGWDYVEKGDGALEPAEWARRMVQNAVIACAADPRWGPGGPSFAFVKEGPYAVPVIERGTA